MLVAALTGQAAPSLGAMSPSLEARVDASAPADRIAVIATPSPLSSTTSTAP